MEAHAPALDLVERSATRAILQGVAITVAIYLAVGAIIVTVRGCADHGEYGPNLHLGARE